MKALEVKSLLKISKKPASAWVRSLAGLRRICWSPESSSSGRKYPDGLLGRGGSRSSGTIGRSSGGSIAFSGRRSNDFFFDRLNNGSDDRVRNHLDAFRNNEVVGVQGRAGFHLGEVNGDEFRQIARQAGHFDVGGSTRDDAARVRLFSRVPPVRPGRDEHDAQTV